MRESPAFLSASPPQPLLGGEIHLWFFPRWRHSAVATASVVLRDLLAGYLQCPAESVRLERDTHGKPRLADAALQFNLSHAGDALLVALSRAIAVGVDLESVARRTRRTPLELARRFFAPAETSALAALPEDQCQAVFLRLWTCKEAVLKAHGGGISFGLDRVDVALADDGAVLGLRSAPSAEAWQVVVLRPDAGHVGALAWPGNVTSIRAFVTPAIAAGPQSG